MRLMAPAGILLILTALLGASGCASFRGIPSHGGGKRFDEEQRIVSGAIRYAVAHMTFPELEGKQARILVTSVPTSGAGNVNFGGLQDISLNGSVSDSTYDLLRRLIPLQYPFEREVFRWDTDDEMYNNSTLTTENYNTQNLDEYREDERTSMGGNLRYRMDHSFFTQRSNTEGDVKYLQAVLEMKARHAGVTIDTTKPACMLYVLIDVLGTNRRRQDFVLWKMDDLVATCEVTYYARDMKTGKLLFPARRAAGRAKYREDRVWPFGAQVVSHQYMQTEPAPFPTTCVETGEGTATAPGDSAGNDKPTPGKGNGDNDVYLDVLIERARAQLRSGNTQDAFDSLRSVITTDPNHPGLQEIKDEFSIELPTAP